MRGYFLLLIHTYVMSFSRELNKNTSWINQGTIYVERAIPVNQAAPPSHDSFHPAFTWTFSILFEQIGLVHMKKIYPN